jgi:hypothetical protein
MAAALFTSLPVPRDLALEAPRDIPLEEWRRSSEGRRGSRDRGSGGGDGGGGQPKRRGNYVRLPDDFLRVPSTCVNPPGAMPDEGLSETFSVTLRKSQG